VSEMERAIEWLRKEKKWRVGYEPTEYIDTAIDAIRAQSEAERKIEVVKTKLELLRKDAPMLDSIEHAAMDYVIDLTLEILEETE